MRPLRFAVLALFGAAPVYAAPPIWTTYPRLMCRADVSHFCNIEGSKPCKTDTASAIFTFDFPADSFKSFVSPKPGKILMRFHKELTHVGDQNAVFTDWGSTFYFFQGPKDIIGQPQIMGTVLNADKSQSYALNLLCRPV